MRTITTQFTARPTDISVFSNVSTVSSIPVTLGFGSGSGVQGPEKAAQFFTMFIMTDAGSVQFDSTFGSDFIEAMLKGNIKDSSTLKLAFNTAVVDVLNYVRANFSSWPDDERLVKIELLDYSFDTENAKVTLRVGLTTAAGSTATVVLPMDKIAV